jgi:hypothetical protein
MNGFVIDLHMVLSPSDVYLWDPIVFHSWRLQFIIEVSAWSSCDETLLHSMLTIHHRSLRLVLSPCDGTLLHPTCTCGTCSYSSVTLAIRHRSLRLVISQWDGTLLHPTCTYNYSSVTLAIHQEVSAQSFLYMWDPMTCMSRVRLMGPDGTFLHLLLTYGTRWLECHMSDVWAPIAPFSITIWPVGPFSISTRPVGPNGLRLTCCRWGLINSNSKKLWDLGVKPGTRNKK